MIVDKIQVDNIEVVSSVKINNAIFEISNYGNVKPIFNCIYNKGSIHNKYPKITLLNMTISYNVHRLVYGIYIGVLNKNMHIHHIDGNTFNNNYKNLKQLTILEHRAMHSKTKEPYITTIERNGNTGYIVKIKGVYIDTIWNNLNLAKLTRDKELNKIIIN